MDDDDDDDKCFVCNKEVDFTVDPPILHDDCGHYACAGTCSDGSGDTCKRCVETAAAVRAAPVAAKAPLVVRVPRTESTLFGGFLARANSISAPIRNRHNTPETSKDPHWLVSLGPSRVPVSMLIQKGLDFNTCVADNGLTIQDFLDGGYTIGDLAEFPEVSPQMSRGGILPLGVQALMAMKTTATHFRQNPVALPMDKVAAITGLQPKHLVENFCLAFHPIEGIMSLTGPRTPPDTDWAVEDLHRMGFTTMDSFIHTLGLRKLSHWYNLRPSKIDLKLLGTTVDHLQQLEQDAAPTTTPAPELEPVASSVRATIPRGTPCVMIVSADGTLVKAPRPTRVAEEEKRAYSPTGVVQYSFDG